MGTIVERGDSFRAVVRKKGHKTRTKSFPKRALAKQWILETEAALFKKELCSTGQLLGPLVQRFIEEILPLKGDNAETKKGYKYVAKALAAVSLEEFVDIGIIEIMRTKFPGSKPQSISRYWTRVCTALSAAEAFWGISVPWKEIRLVKKHMEAYGVISKGKERTRRISDAEIEAIKDKVSSAIPVNDIIDFAIATALRSAEITRVARSDLNREKRTLLVRDRKHPKEKVGNNTEIPLLGDSLQVIDRQKTEGDIIFPYNPRSVEAAFRRAVRLAKIEDLHFHDMRHEAISRLFEAGYSIQEVALVSGHKSWNSLKIYTNLRPESLHR